MAHVILVILIIIQGVCGGDWSVVLKSQCGIRGSSVVIPCSYDYPVLVYVTSTVWSRGEYIGNQWKLSHLSLTGRFEYLGNKAYDCTLRINTLKHSDEGAYFFSFATTLSSLWSGPNYASLSIKDLTAVVKPSTVAEGEKVRLSCTVDCPSSPPSVVWFRDAQPVTNLEFQARTKDAGSYYCAVEGQEATRSAPVTLNVQYLPENTSVSISGDSPEDLVEGSSVNLTCSSDANPPVYNYAWWYQRTGSPGSSSPVQVGSEQVLVLTSLKTSQSGLYFCHAMNSLGENNSTEMSLEIQQEYQLLPVLVGVGVTLLVTLVVAFGVLVLCMKRRTPANKQLGSVSAPYVGTTLQQEETDLIYANVHYSLSSPPSPDGAVVYSTVQHHSSGHVSTTGETKEVLYSTVTIQPKDKRRTHHHTSSSTALQDKHTQFSSLGQEADSVIYSTVAKGN